MTTATQTPFKARRARVLKLLKESGQKTALVICSNPHRQRTHDQRYPYRPNSDLYYLTGTLAPDITLVIRSDEATPVIVGLPHDPVKAVWEGTPPKPKSIANLIGAELIESSSPLSAVQKLLAGYEVAITQPIIGTVGYNLSERLLSLNASGNEKLPRTVSNSDSLMAKLRLYKSKEEIARIREAAEITGHALFSILPMVQPECHEFEISTSIDYLYRLNGGEPAFETIVATGPSAATLHYHFKNRKLRRGELLLIDTGIEKDMYSSDITRTLPVGGKFEPVQAALYEIVLEAQSAAIKKIRHGVLIREVYMAAAQVLTRGLVDLKVLRGKVSSLMAKAAYKPWFPHGIGHSLGLDVHDIGELRGNNAAVLEEGMVFTVEPGLYFSKPAGVLPACGVRIEDNVVVTRKGCQVITDGIFPKEIDEVEGLFQ